jgi:hypothetical protein
MSPSPTPPLHLDRLRTNAPSGDEGCRSAQRRGVRLAPPPQAPDSGLHQRSGRRWTGGPWESPALPWEIQQGLPLKIQCGTTWRWPLAKLVKVQGTFKSQRRDRRAKSDQEEAMSSWTTSSGKSNIEYSPTNNSVCWDPPTEWQTTTVKGSDGLTMEARSSGFWGTQRWHAVTWRRGELEAAWHGVVAGTA